MLTLESLVLFLLIPDQVQPRIFNEQVVPKLRETAAIVIASGYNVFYKLLNFNPKQDVIMVAPRSVLCKMLDEVCDERRLQDDWLFRSLVVRERKRIPLFRLRGTGWDWRWIVYRVGSFTRDWCDSGGRHRVFRS